MSSWKTRILSIAGDASTPLLLTGAVFAVGAAFAGGLLDALGNNPTFSFALAGCLVMHLTTRPSRLEMAATILLGLSLRAAFAAAVGFSPYWGSWLISSAGFLGIASLMILGVVGLRSGNFSPLARAAFLPFSGILIGFLDLRRPGLRRLLMTQICWLWTGRLDFSRVSCSDGC